MSSRTCAYVASRDDPESWHGTDPSEFGLDYNSPRGLRIQSVSGLGISEWHCPHPPLGQDLGDEEYCVFHTDMEVSADYQRQKLLEGLNDAGNRPYDDRPEHRGQFVGATFGAIDLSDETIAATDNHDIRFDHAQFRGNDKGLGFARTKFIAQGQHPISFVGAEFITDGAGSVWFEDATFRTGGAGDVMFINATFRTDGAGNVEFKDATFRADSVHFEDATVRTDGDGNVGFEDATFTNAILTHVDFAGANLQGVDLTGAVLWEANVADVSVNGATTCRRLYEGAQFTPDKWDATARNYHDLKTVFSGHGLVGKAWAMHIRERRARSREAKAVYGRFDRRYLRSLPSRIFTGYGVRVQNLVLWMMVLFLISTSVYVYVGVEDTLLENVSYSVLAFTVAPPEVPEGVGTQVMMMVETFLGTLSIVLLGYILGNRQQF